VDPDLPTPDWFQCAPLETRRRSFLEALQSDADILWAARGGFGTAQWLAGLPEDKSLWQGKRLVGFSDLTALHSWASNRGLSTYHAPMIATRGWVEATPEEVSSWTRAVVEDCPDPISFSQGSLEPLRSGRLIGGNLTVLASLMGTPHQLRLEAGDLLFLEDIQEPPYRLARSLFQLSHSPNFEKVQLLWGQLTDCGLCAPELVTKLMSSYSNPWGLGVEAGHDRPNKSLRFGEPVSIKDQILSFPSG